MKNIDGLNLVVFDSSGAISGLDFPKEQLVEIFRPFFYYSYIVNYDIRGTHKVLQYKKILYYKLLLLFLIRSCQVSH